MYTRLPIFYLLEIYLLLYYSQIRLRTWINFNVISYATARSVTISRVSQDLLHGSKNTFDVMFAKAEIQNKAR